MRKLSALAMLGWLATGACFAGTFQAKTFHYDKTVDAFERFIADSRYYLHHKSDPDERDIRNDTAALCYLHLGPISNLSQEVDIAILDLTSGPPELGVLPEIAIDNRYREPLDYGIASGLGVFASFCASKKMIVKEGEEPRVATLDDVDEAIEKTMEHAESALNLLKYAQAHHK